jgi:hypothetical protein
MTFHIHCWDTWTFSFWCSHDRAADIWLALFIDWALDCKGLTLMVNYTVSPYLPPFQKWENIDSKPCWLIRLTLIGHGRSMVDIHV